MDGVATPIIGRPRPLPGHDTPNPAYHPHTLNYEEPVFVVRILWRWRVADVEVVCSSIDANKGWDIKQW